MQATSLAGSYGYQVVINVIAREETGVRSCLIYFEIDKDYRWLQLCGLKTLISKQLWAKIDSIWDQKKKII